MYHQNKNNILVGYLVNDHLSVVIIFEHNARKMILSQQQWNKFTTENTFKSIFEAISTTQPTQRFKLDNDFYYKINMKTDSVNLQLKNKRITLSRNYVYNLKLWHDCINLSISNKNNKLETYQRRLNDIFTLMKNEISYLSPNCIRHDFVSLYIQDYKFNMDELSDEDRLFTLELQRMHYNDLANILIKSFYTY